MATMRLADPVQTTTPLVSDDRQGFTALRRPWPLTTLLVGFPVFWFLGLSEFAVPIMSVPMAWALLWRRPLSAPRGFGVWLLFLAWSLAGFVVLGVNPPGTLPGSAASRFLGFGLREVAYVSVTIVLLYVGNLSKHELSEPRLLRLLGWLFVWTTAGGVLGMMWPSLQFTSVTEHLLPQSVASNLYVQHLVHPAAAQVQDLISGATPRPAAPFGYTNTWGFHITLLAPFFFLGWLRPARGLRRVAYAGVLVVAAVTLIYSLNRAAWIAAALMVAYVAVRIAMRGRLVPLSALSLVSVLAVGIFLASPLQGVVQQRLEHGQSNDIRSFTTQRALELSARSPVIGYGSTRATYGSASSIAVGKSADCQQCGNVSIGINGYLYMLMMSTGYVGTVLFFGFWLTTVWRARRSPSPVVLVAGLTILTASFYAFFYDVATWLLVPFLALAMLWRAQPEMVGFDGTR